MYPALSAKPTENQKMANFAPYSVELVRVVKVDGQLGITIVGGVDQPCRPFGYRDAPGVFISQILANGPASQANLRTGDRLLEVNGINLRQATHNEAIAALTTKSNELQLLVRHDPQPPGLQIITIFRQPNQPLGLSIRGGINNPPGNPYDKIDDGIFVTNVFGGEVGDDGRIQIGHRLLEINGITLLGASHEEAVMLLRNVDGHFTVTVCDGWNQQTSTSPRRK